VRCVGFRKKKGLVPGTGLAHYIGITILLVAVRGKCFYCSGTPHAHSFTRTLPRVTSFMHCSRGTRTLSASPIRVKAHGQIARACSLRHVHVQYSNGWSSGISRDDLRPLLRFGIDEARGSSKSGHPSLSSSQQPLHGQERCWPGGSPVRRVP
jgi:hypothetical protein